jgi:hypothetical protein
LIFEGSIFLIGVDFGRGHLEALARNLMSQVLGLRAEEAALAHLASQSGPNKAFKDEIETMKHLLKRSLLPLFEGVTIAGGENADIIQAGHADVPHETFQYGIHDATHVGRSGLKTEREVVELVLAAMRNKGRVSLCPLCEQGVPRRQKPNPGHTGRASRATLVRMKVDRWPRRSAKEGCPPAAVSS